MEATTDDSNPYSLDGAIHGLLEVGGLGDQRSLQKLKKPEKTGDDEGVAISTDEAPSKVRSKDEKLFTEGCQSTRKEVGRFQYSWHIVRFQPHFRQKSKYVYPADT
jgi:hypothetical protein